MNILLGITGSVAATLAPKLVQALQDLGTVRVVLTDKGAILSGYPWEGSENLVVYTDKDEWEPRWKTKGDPILHTDLKNWADALVIAPCTANTLAKMANGIADNLLTSVYRAWPCNKPLIYAPAMNSDMWARNVTGRNLRDTSGVMVPPQFKSLPCGDTGVGAMANIDRIVSEIPKACQWRWPLWTPPTSSGTSSATGNGIPVGGKHPGSFGFVRKHDTHTGIDLYCKEGTLVCPVEPGVIVAIEPFTGKNATDPVSGKPMSWWNDTSVVLVKGPSGVIAYGEIQPDENLKVGSEVTTGFPIGKVIPVLPKGKERPDIAGHSRSMLHLELWSDATEAWQVWQNEKPRPQGLGNPTSFLQSCRPTHIPELW